MSRVSPALKTEQPTGGGARAYALPYTVRQAKAPDAAVIFASPHSGTTYPDDMRSALSVPLMDLRRTEDAFVDELFADAPEFGATLISAHYGRTVADLNRDPRELDPAMFSDGVPRVCGVPTARVEAGLGCLPNVGAKGEIIYNRLLTRHEGEARLSQIHDRWHSHLSEMMGNLKQAHGAAVLIDCHSMPSVQPGRRRLADIVLGDRFGSSCDHRLTGRIERAFRGFGLTVARNAPYAGGYTTRTYGRPKRGRHAVQIEINRALYMDEQQILRSERFSEMRTIIAGVIREIVEVSQSLASR